MKQAAHQFIDLSNPMLGSLPGHSCRKNSTNTVAKISNDEQKVEEETVVVELPATSDTAN